MNRYFRRLPALALILCLTGITARGAEPSFRKSAGQTPAGTRSPAELQREKQMIEDLGRSLEAMGLDPKSSPLRGLPVGLYNVEFEGPSYGRNTIAFFSLEGKQIWIMGKIPRVDSRDPHSTIALLGLLQRHKLLLPGFVQYYRGTDSINLFYPTGKSKLSPGELQECLQEFDYKMYWARRSQSMNLEIERTSLEKESVGPGLPGES